MKSVFSTGVDDAVYALLKLRSQVTGVLSVNWSDETYRKMSTSITTIGTHGKIISDGSELKVYFKDSKSCPDTYSKGWNIKYVTELAEPVDFYLRGEEYSAQTDFGQYVWRSSNSSKQRMTCLTAGTEGTKYSY